MGWLIVFGIAIIISIALMILDKYCWDTIFIEGSGFILLWFAAFCATAIVLEMCDVKYDTIETISEYESLQYSTAITVVPSEALLQNILDMNKKISKCRTRANNFMTKGMYSEEIANLEYLPIPESFLNVEIGYD